MKPRRLERAQDRRQRRLRSHRLQGAGPERRPTTAACWSTSCSASGSASIRAASSARTVAGISGSAPPSCSRWRDDLLGVERVALGDLDDPLGAAPRRRPGASPRRDRASACASSGCSATCHVPGADPSSAAPRASSGRAVATTSSGPPSARGSPRPCRAAAGSAQWRSSIATTVGARAASALEEARPGEPDLLRDRLRRRVAQRAPGSAPRRPPARARRVRSAASIRLARAARGRARSTCRRRRRRCRRAGHRPRPTGSRAAPSRRCPPRRPGSARGARRAGLDRHP